MFKIKTNRFFKFKTLPNVSKHLYSQQTNEVGVQMINEKLRSQIFCKPKKLIDEACVNEAKKRLIEDHKLNIDSIDSLKDVDNLKMPALNGLFKR